MLPPRVPVQRQPRLTAEEREEDEAIAAGAAELDVDLQDDEQDDWADIMRQLAITPSAQTLQAAGVEKRQKEKEKKKRQKKKKSGLV